VTVKKDFAPWSQLSYNDYGNELTVAVTYWLLTCSWACYVLNEMENQSGQVTGSLVRFALLECTEL